MNRRGFLGMLGRGAVAATIAPAVKAVMPASSTTFVLARAEEYEYSSGLDLASFDAALRQYYTDEAISRCVLSENPLLTLSVVP